MQWEQIAEEIMPAFAHVKKRADSSLINNP